MNPPATEPEVLTEVPEGLKRLVRYIVRGFYEIEHALVIDLLVHHPCIREEDLLDLLKFDQKQLRSAVNTLKNDKFIKVRMRMETNSEGRTNKQNYYFINYSTFVNVCKYKLDHIRRKIEMEERTMTSRASFKCPGCQKTFTDLEAGQLFDPFTGQMNCTFCRTEVEEDSSVELKTDARTLMVKFNEQIEPVFNLLRQVEDVKLSQELLEPEPVDLGRRGANTGAKNTGKGGWSGDKRQGMFNYNDSGVTINIEGEQDKAAAPTVPLKERPIWMTESTIQGAEGDQIGLTPDLTGSIEEQPIRSQETDDIMKTLLAHEKKAAAPVIPEARPPVSDDSSSSDSEAEMSYKPPIIKPTETTGDTEEEEEEVPMVIVAGQPVPYDEITEEHTQKMTPTERDAYIRIGQEMYQNMYD